MIDLKGTRAVQVAGTEKATFIDFSV